MEPGVLSGFGLRRLVSKGFSNAKAGNTDRKKSHREFQAYRGSLPGGACNAQRAVKLRRPEPKKASGQRPGCGCAESMENCKCPRGVFGRLLAKTMNKGHAPLSRWAFSVCPPVDGESVLDIGCGGGGNLLRLLKSCPRSYVMGVDYSETSVACSLRLTSEWRNRCSVICADVMNLPVDSGLFDRAVSFESVYFWPNPVIALTEIARVLKPHGKVTVVTEMSDPQKGKFWTKRCPGMTVYTPEELVSFLEKAGFSDVNVYRTHKVWCAVEGKKK